MVRVLETLSDLKMKLSCFVRHPQSAGRQQSRFPCAPGTIRLAFEILQPALTQRRARPGDWESAGKAPHDLAHLSGASGGLFGIRCCCAGLPQREIDFGNE